MSSDHSVSAYDVGDLLRALIEKSLVAHDRESDRFRMSEAVKEYGSDKLAGLAESDELRSRHRAHFRERLKTAGSYRNSPEKIERLNGLAADYPDVRLALRAYLDDEVGIDQSLEMVDSCHDFWFWKNYISEGLSLAEAALQKAAGENGSRAHATALHVAGNMATTRGDYARARALYERELEMRESIGDTRGLAGVLGSLGSTAQYQGDLDNAKALFERALAICSEIKHQSWERVTRVCMGNLATEAGDYEEAVEHLTIAIGSAQADKDRFLEAQARSALVTPLVGLKRIPEARSAAEQSLSLFGELGHSPSELGAMCYLAHCIYLEGDYEQSWKAQVEMFRRLAELMSETSLRMVAAMMERFAQLCSATGRVRLAAVCAGFAENARERCGAPLPSTDKPAMNELTVALQKDLGEEEYERAFSECRHLEPEEALAIVRGQMQ